MRIDKAMYIVRAHKAVWNILHAGAGSSSKLGYFPDKSIEKAVGTPLDEAHRFGESYHPGSPERTRRTGTRRRRCQRSPSLPAYPRCAI
jgi:hypothetical protein